MQIRFSLAITLCLAFGSIGSTRAETGLTVKAGVGYEYMSQEFYLDSLQYSGSDSLEVSTTLKTTYLDDAKAQLTLSYLPFDDYRLEVRSCLEQTPDQFRLRLATDFRPRFGSVAIDWSSELERRDDNQDSGETDDGYYSGYGRAKLKYPLFGSTAVWGQLRADFVSFDSAGSGAFDYYRAGGQFGITHTFSNFSSLDVDYFFMNRDVSDSTELDYLSYGLESSLFGFYDGGEIDVVSRVGIRDYNRVADLGDYLRAEFTARNKHRLDDAFFAREELDFEYLRYDSAVVLPESFRRLEVTLMAGYSKGNWSLAIGPELEWLNEDQVDEYTVGSDYFEAGLNTQFDLIEPGLIFASIESVTGSRSLKDKGALGDLHSDFVFERLNLLTDAQIVAGLGLNLLLAADWEWHDNDQENSRLFLISTSIYYSF